jgi:shikimate kinase
MLWALERFMKLIILHGPPASGKLTLANRLKDELGYNVLHNHLTVDLALEVYSEFGEGDFYDFVDKLRSLAIEKACKNKMEGLIVTFCFDVAIDMKIVEYWESIVSNYGGKILPIYINVSAEVLAERVVNTSRIGTKKLQCPSELNMILSKNEFGAIPNKNTITVDTNFLCVEKSVRVILEHTL